jgi:hypothetical protein
MVNRQILLQNEYLAAENRILRAHLPIRLRLTDPQRSTLAEIGKRLGRRALQAVACAAKPDTILAWYRRLVAQKFDGSKYRRYPGRPSVNREVTELVLRLARENTGWGYDRMLGHWRTQVTAFRISGWATSYGAGIAPVPSVDSKGTGLTSFAHTWLSSSGH